MSLQAEKMMTRDDGERRNNERASIGGGKLEMMMEIMIVERWRRSCWVERRG